MEISIISPVYQAEQIVEELYPFVGSAYHCNPI